ncbi:hypothetical protein [Sorangium sp. So ce590]|uniref:hypothetical protein n=1 Tax=unclassified Sorangium TaxID=2621164 RepID=UPI003F622F67
MQEIDTSAVCGADHLDQVMRLDPKLSQNFEVLGEVVEPGCRPLCYFSSRLQVATVVIIVA